MDAIKSFHRPYFIGICALVAVVIIWVSSSFALNSILGEQHYNKPFLVTYLSTTTFIFYLIPYALQRQKETPLASDEIRLINIPGDDADEPDDNSMEEAQDIQVNDQAEPVTQKLKTAEMAKLSLMFCMLWFLANYTTNASLAYTSVASSTIFTSTSGLFTLAIGSMFGVEQLTLVRVCSVCICFIGVVIVSLNDQLSDNHGSHPTLENSSPLIGDLLALFGALCYGSYTTLLKLRIGDGAHVDMPLFFGFVGAFNMILLWPLFFVFHWTGIETFEVPHGGKLWAMLLLNAFLGTFLSDYLWLFAMLLTSPLVVTLGVSLTIPLALVGDVVFKHIFPGIYYTIGAVLVVTGFLVVNMAALSEDDSSRKKYPEHELLPQSNDDDSLIDTTYSHYPHSPSISYPSDT